MTILAQSFPNSRRALYVRSQTCLGTPQPLHPPASDVRSCLRCAGQLSQVAYAQHARLVRSYDALWHHRPRPPRFDLLAVDGTAAAALEAEPLGGGRPFLRLRRRRLRLHGPRARPRLESRGGGAARCARHRDGPACGRALPCRSADRRHAGWAPCLLRATRVPDWWRSPCDRRRAPACGMSGVPFSVGPPCSMKRYGGPTSMKRLQ